MNNSIPVSQMALDEVQDVSAEELANLPQEVVSVGVGDGTMARLDGKVLVIDEDLDGQLVTKIITDNAGKIQWDQSLASAAVAIRDMGLTSEDANAAMQRFAEEVQRQNTHVVAESDVKVEERETIRMFGTNVGRNQPCPCGSGKKRKKCGCGTDSRIERNTIKKKIVVLNNDALKRIRAAERRGQQVRIA